MRNPISYSPLSLSHARVRPAVRVARCHSERSRVKLRGFNLWLLSVRSLSPPPPPPLPPSGSALLGKGPPTRCVYYASFRLLKSPLIKVNTLRGGARLSGDRTLGPHVPSLCCARPPENQLFYICPQQEDAPSWGHRMPTHLSHEKGFSFFGGARPPGDCGRQDSGDCGKLGTADRVGIVRVSDYVATLAPCW